MSTIQLGERATLIRGITFKPVDKCAPEDDGAIVCMRTKNVQVTLDQTDLIAVPRTLVKSPDKMLSEGDILVSSANSWNLVGKCCQVRDLLFPSTAGGFISILRPTTEDLDADYLYRWFSSDGIQVTLRSFGNQTTNISNLNHKRTLKLRLPLPSLAEQKRIAGILDAADALRAKRREALAQLDTLLQSTFLDMFGDPVTNPMAWEKRRIESVFGVARGGSPRPIQAYLTESEDGLNWIMIGDATESSRYITSTNKRIKPEGLRKSRMVREGDLLLTNSMSFGKPYILKTEGCIHDGWLVLSPKDKRMSVDFFYSLLSTATLYREFKKKAAGAVVKNLNTKLVKQVSVPVPPLDLQHQFAAIVESVERQKARQQAHLAELDTLFASLQSRAFRGDL